MTLPEKEHHQRGAGLPNHSEEKIGETSFGVGGGGGGGYTSTN
jgi:hypothetical protein